MAAALTDAHLPEPWRQHLSERHQQIAVQLEQHRAQALAQPPAWTREHLPKPDAGPRVQRAWARLVVDVETYRGTHRIPASETAPIPDRHASDDPAAAQLRDRLVKDGALYRRHHDATLALRTHGRSAARPAPLVDELVSGPDPLLRRALAVRGEQQIRRSTLRHRGDRDRTTVQRQDEWSTAQQLTDTPPGQVLDPDGESRRRVQRLS